MSVPRGVAAAVVSGVGAVVAAPGVGAVIVGADSVGAVIVGADSEVPALGAVGDDWANAGTATLASNADRATAERVLFMKVLLWTVIDRGSAVVFGRTNATCTSPAAISIVDIGPMDDER
jgi:hypothetical protein